MNITDYETSGRELYAEFCGIVAKLLERAIQGQQGYRLQQIQSRAKDPFSLRARLEEADAVESDQIENLRKDLAGCRVVFYTNNDVNRFTTSGLLEDLFEIDLNRSKFHQPGLESQNTRDLFQSYNYVVRLKDDRTALAEYARFEGLWCEVQVQTTLNHAWAEMAHDIIYKRPETKGFGSREMAMIDRSLGKLMTEHLLPTGYIFQKIAIDIQRLMDGKELFNSGAVDAVLEASDNNDRRDAAERLRDDVLPHYDDVPTEFPDIREKLKRAWLVAHDTETKPRETPFGSFPGAEPHDVAKVIADIFKRCRYFGPEDTYAAIRDLFLQTNDPKSRECLITVAEKLSAHTLDIWKEHGPVMQTLLAAALKAEENLGAMAPVAAAICGEILKPEIRGSSSGSNTITFHTGTIVHSEALADARRDAIDTLVQLATEAPSVEGRNLVLSNLFLAGEAPHRGVCGHDVTAMILDDCAYMLRALLPILTEKPMDVRQDCEQSVLRLWRRYRSLPDDLMGDAKVTEAQARLMDAIMVLRGALNDDGEFVIFKTLVGFRSVFPHMWDDDGRDFEKDQRIRDESQDELLDSIAEETWDTWTRRLSTAAGVKSKDGATFPPLDRFFEKVATRHPVYGLNLLGERGSLPRWTLAPIAGALLETEANEAAKTTLLTWAENGDYLPELAFTAIRAKTVDPELVLRVAEISRGRKDEDACALLLEAATRRFSQDRAFWRDKIFFPCLEILRASENHRWIDRTWFSAREDSLFANLSAEQRASVLDAMISAPLLDHRAEAILLSIAGQDHIAVLEYFGQRIKRKGERDKPFDAVPFSFHEVNEALQSHPIDILNALRRWSYDADGSAPWQVSHFLSRVYPEFQPPLPDALGKLIDGADEDTLFFVASIVDGFQGRESLLPILHAILNSDAANGQIQERVWHVFHENGLMTGEFGAAQTYQAKADSIRPWLEDGSARVRAFAEREVRSLENMAAAERRRAREEIALRRLQYGEPLDGSIPTKNKVRHRPHRKVCT